MSETVERRPFLETGLGCFVTAFTVVVVLLTVGGVWAYVALRGLEPLGDLDVPDIDVDVPDIDFDALLPPEAGQVTALDAATGEERWTRRFGSRALPVGLHNDVVVVRKQNGDIVAVDIATGSTRWRRTTHRSSGYPDLSASTVVFISRGRSVIALDAATGAERWQTRGLQIRTDLLLVGGGLAVVRARQPNELIALDLATGTVRWTIASPARGSDSVSGVIVEDLVVLRIGADAVALEASTGATRWTWDHPPVEPDDDFYLSFLKAPISSGPTVGLQMLGPAADGFPTTSTVFVDRATGVERWRTASGALSSFAFDGTTLYEYGEGERLRAWDPLSGALHYEVPNGGGRLFAAPGTLFVAGDEVSAADPPTGITRWTHRLGANANATGLGVTNNLLVVASAELGSRDTRAASPPSCCAGGATAREPRWPGARVAPR